MGRQLVKQGILSKSVVRAALEEQERTGARLGEILVARGALDQETLVGALAFQGMVDTVTPADRATSLLPISVAFEHRAVAIESNGNGNGSAVTLVALSDLAAVPAICEALDAPIEPKLTDADTLERLIGEAYPDVVDAAPGDAEALVEPPSPVEPESSTEIPTSSPVAPGPSATAVPAESPAVVPQEAAESESAIPSPSDEAPATAASPARRRRRLFGRRTEPAPVQSTWTARPVTSAPAAVEPEQPEPRPEPEAQIPVEVAPPPAVEAPAPEPELPHATVIVGLREATPATFAHVVDVLDRIDYPRDRLEVLAIVDPADRVTRRSLHAAPLPSWITETITSRSDTPGPRGLLLRGLHAARGEFVMVVRPGHAVDTAMLRRVADGSDLSALVPSDVYAPRRLTNAFLRQVEPPPFDALVHDGVEASRATRVFRVAELRDAFGWTAEPSEAATSP